MGTLSYILLYYIHYKVYIRRLYKIVRTPQTPDNRLKMPKGSGLTKPLTLSPELAELVEAKKGEQLSRPEVVKRIWAYLKKHKLQDPENKQYFTPDEAMKPIFGEEKVRAFGMAKFLKAHLTSD